MLDEKRVKLMTKLALYEETQGKDDFKVSEYYRKDYVGMHMICTFLWVTNMCVWLVCWHLPEWMQSSPKCLWDF